MLWMIIEKILIEPRETIDMLHMFADREKVYQAIVIVNFFREQVLQAQSAHPGAYQIAMLDGIRTQRYIAEQVSQSLAEIPLYVETYGDIPKMDIPETLRRSTGNLTGFPKPGTISSNLAGNIDTSILENIPPKLKNSFNVNADNVLRDFEKSLDTVVGNFSGLSGLESLHKLSNSMSPADGGILGAVSDMLGKSEGAKGMQGSVESMAKSFFATLAAGKVIPTTIALKEMTTVASPILRFATQVLVQGDPKNPFANLLNSHDIAMARVAEMMSNDVACAMDYARKQCKSMAKQMDDMGNTSILNSATEAATEGLAQFGFGGSLPLGGNYTVNQEGINVTFGDIPKPGEVVTGLLDKVCKDSPGFNSLKNKCKNGYKNISVEFGGFHV